MTNQGNQGLEYMGRDWCHVYRVPEAASCLSCGDPTRLRLAFSRKTTITMCGRCRGY